MARDRLLKEIIKATRSKTGGLPSISIPTIITGPPSGDNMIGDSISFIPATYVGGEINPTTPPSSRIIIGKLTGFSHGVRIQAPETTVEINLSGDVEVWYLNALQGQIEVSQFQTPNEGVPIGKIIVPIPGTSSRIVDSPSETDAYIIQGKSSAFKEEYKPNDPDLAALRNLLTLLFAENLIGSITLSENLTIANNSGTMSMGSNYLRFFDVDIHKLLDLSPSYGLRLFDSEGRLKARFGPDGAAVGGWELGDHVLRSVDGTIILDAANNTITVGGTGDLIFTGINRKWTIDFEEFLGSEILQIYPSQINPLPVGTLLVLGSNADDSESTSSTRIVGRSSAGMRSYDGVEAKWRSLDFVGGTSFRSEDGKVALGGPGFRFKSVDVSEHISTPLVKLVERSADPPEPDEGEAITWLSDGTEKGDDGDVMVASKAGGVTKYGTLFDHSTGANW